MKNNWESNYQNYSQSFKCFTKGSNQFSLGAWCIVAKLFSKAMSFFSRDFNLNWNKIVMNPPIVVKSMIWQFKDFCLKVLGKNVIQCSPHGELQCNVGRRTWLFPKFGFGVPCECELSMVGLCTILVPNYTNYILSLCSLIWPWAWFTNSF